MSSSKGMKFGIDLGTTYSSIGWYDSDAHRVDIAQLDSAHSSHLLPSAIFIESPDNVVGGTTAVNAGLEKPERLFRWFKRDMGNPPDPAHVVDGKQWTPVECSAEILKTLKSEGEIYFNAEVKDVVITYPAWFTPRQKDLTKEAAIKAGLNVIRMIEEPQAAALAYVIDEVLKRAYESSEQVGELSSLMPQIIERLAGRDSAVLVYDLGGGTFDVAMIQARGEAIDGGNTQLHIKTLYNEGDIVLGGKDWDSEIKELVAELDRTNYGHDPYEDPQAGRLDDECEQKKRDLSRLTSIKILCPSLHQIEITRDMVKERTTHLLERTRQITETVIAEAIDKHGISKDRITLLLAGGMCKWPPVVEMLTEIMDGRKPVVHKNVDFMVVNGAAYLAYLSVISEEKGAWQEEGDQPSDESIESQKVPVISKGTGKSGITVMAGGIEVPYPAIGVEVLDEKDPAMKKTYVARVIPSNSIVGDFYEETFSTTHDNQEQVELTLFFLKEHEGHKDDEKELTAWEKYKTFRMTGLPPKPKGQPIHVRLKYAEGGVIEGRAWDDSGQEIDIEGKTAGG